MTQVYKRNMIMTEEKLKVEIKVLRKNTSIPVHLYTSHPKCQYTSPPVYQSLRIPVYQSTCIPVTKNTSIPAHLYTSRCRHHATPVFDDSALEIDAPGSRWDTGSRRPMDHICPSRPGVIPGLQDHSYTALV